MKKAVVKNLESNIGFIIDKKTLKNISANLEKLGLVKILEFELTMKNKHIKYSKNKTEIKQSKIDGAK